MTGYLFIIFPIVIAFILGALFNYVLSKPKIIGTLILNKDSKDKPFFELHFEDDPEEQERRGIVAFRLEVH